MMSPAQVAKLLDVYSSSGRIDVKPISLPGPHPNLPGLQQLFNEKRKELKRLDELIPYNDCLYTNMYRYLFTMKPWLECTLYNEEFWITNLVSDELLHSTYPVEKLSRIISIRVPSRYKWLGLLDIDEVIVPRKQNSLVEMMDEIESKEEVKGFTSWSFISFLSDMRSLRDDALF